MEYAIVVEGLTKYYGKLLAVDHINFKVRKREIFGLLGPNGAGKTTTIRMLCGLTKITEGTAKIFGYDVRKEEDKVKRVIGVVPDTSNLYWDLTVFDNLMFSAEMYMVPRKERKKRVAQLIEFFGLKEKSLEKFKNLSKGLKRRVVIASALVHNPKILFLDEPTLGLDIKSKRQIWQLIKTLNKRGLTIFLTTHNIYEAFKLCNKIAIINKGKIVAIGSPSELRSKVSENRVIEIQTNPSLEPDSIKNISGVNSVVKEKDGTLKILVADPISALEGIISVIKAHNLDLVMLSLRGADAEEVFLRLIEEQL